ncbi:hypothetical protein AB6A40_004109 [Gnathostoma spinigerum]|uniref:Uncharacterized protein n=1 Tax=Gnathostoma spinigerum TaxID=75299 RepID=A0ABD6EM90_9BILA
MLSHHLFQLLSFSLKSILGATAHKTKELPEVMRRWQMVSGCLFITFPALFIVTSALVNTVILRQSSLRSMTAYRIIFLLNVFCSFHLLARLISGIMSFCNIKFDPAFNGVIGALLLSSWEASVAMVLVLAVFRATSIVKSTVDARWTYLQITVAVTYGLVCFIVFLTPEFTIDYDLNESTWNFVSNSASIATLSVVLTTVTLSTNFLMLLVYVATTIFIIQKVHF